ncbi:RNA-metabolising metallo-beta-lactamase [Pseudopedobacter saltans DSM 12145]|uniref:RNA-metabolising metallo-beta-lactamase n=1 Tax=Pseudopedobacter saltans (strain ATCC 51119 / DSM 12145 / JCM 21818 / CCUG 39354 / LMG 10337 / NBRC 100064 / NCIMB 13643) TaxID=762903 RepID=F0S931_PSESL|nr:MBL fold metallo-hydrolase [Pseudopedobacter saltans]ADY51329.1 RNA-metabolising metallo-beta-lactamase [Pseudopedobacter saltans DSM 12145]
MKLTCWGAAKQVTGSMHLLDIDNYRILIDCGLDYEGGKDLSHNANFPFNPAEIDLIILTHAHIDHSGNIPTLIKEGYKGQILCTPPTAELSQLLLSDAVNLFFNKKKGNPKGRRKLRNRSQADLYTAPLYLQKHVMDTADRMVTVAYHKQFQIRDNISLEFIPTGHLLGAAACKLTVSDNGVQKTITFTGDIGRQNSPVLVDPEILSQTEYLVCESTYGGKHHSTDSTIEETLIKHITETCLEQPGRLIIPAFSVGRTQALVYSLNKIFSKKLLPPIPVFVDSPLANRATEVYRKYKNYVNEEAEAFYETYGDKFEFENLSYVKELKESKEIADHFEPCIIISSAGMLEGGRIQDHLFHNIQNIYAKILFIGYCSEGTLGHRLLRGDAFIRLKGKDLAVFAKIDKTDLFSGHADHQDILDYIAAIPKKPKRIFLVHGEQSSMLALKNDLENKDYQVSLPEKGMVFEL